MAIDISAVPKHIGIIMDGNGRWAKQRKLPRTNGHKEGLTVAKQIVKAAAEIGVKYVTLYTFSTENWKRAQEEVGFLMNLIKGHLRAEFQFYKDNGIRIKHLGNLSGLPVEVQKEIIDAINETAEFTGLTVVLAINYGGRDEIIRGIKKIINNNIQADKIDEKLISNFMDMPDSPDVDLLIRTGGEKRLSNYLLWHIPYAEQIYRDTLWPDYTDEDFYKDVEDFQKRNRRFGSEKAFKPNSN